MQAEIGEQSEGKENDPCKMILFFILQCFKTENNTEKRENIMEYSSQNLNNQLYLRSIPKALFEKFCL